MRNARDVLKSPATVEDLKTLPAEVAAEIIHGELVEKASPTWDHGQAQFVLSSQLGRFGGPPRGGAGGWWFATEVEVQYEPREVYRHDLVGWHRERIPKRPKDWPVLIRPDWACEVLSPSNFSNDTVRKQRVLHRHELPHYWLVDPERKTLTVLRWTKEGYLTVLSAEAGEVVRAEPFEALELPIDLLFEDE